MTEVFAQKEKFDIVSFEAPKGFQRTDSNGVLLFQQSKMLNGGQSFCQIFLFPSVASSGNAATDFNNAWGNLITQRMGITGNPTTTSENTPEGLTQTTGYIDVSQQGLVFRCLLVSIMGYNRSMNAVVNFGGPGFTDDVVVFFQKMDVRKEYIIGNLWKGGTPPESGTSSSSNAPASMSDYVYTPPAGWTMKQYSDGTVYYSPVFTGGEQCLLSIWPTRPASNDLLTDANNIFAEVFKAYQLRNDGMSQNKMIRGESPQGWQYYIIKRAIGLRGNGTIGGFVFVAKLGNTLASISGVSKDPLVSNCFGELVNDVWPDFFYSLQFKNYKSQGLDLRKKIAGTWVAASATAATMFTFAPNGRFDNASGAQQYHALSNSEVATTTQAYFGNGAYTIKGYEITMTEDKKKDQPEKGKIRLEEESHDEGRTWAERLYLQRTSSVDGKLYELSLKRDK
jgi:hypothetical protein